MYVISVINTKGGVGKTTLASALAVLALVAAEATPGNPTATRTANAKTDFVIAFPSFIFARRNPPH